MVRSMKGVRTLMRLSANRTEELRASLAETVRARQAAMDELLRYHAHIEAEASVQAISADTLRDWSSWHSRAVRTHRTLQTVLDDLTAQEEDCRDRMRESIADEKRMELALATQRKWERMRLTRKREAAAEETALRRVQDT
jgi:hypothetical protein